MTLFPSTRTDYTMMNERYPPLADVHVRRAISMAIDRNAIIKSVLFGHGTPANSFMPPQVPFYDPQSPGLQYNLAQAKQEMAQSKFPKGFTVQMLVGAGVADEKSIAQIYQQELQKIGIKVVLKPVDPSIEFQDEQQFKYQLGLSYWTMDIADPDELVTFAVVPSAGAKSFYTDYNNPDVIKWTKQAEQTFSVSRPPDALQQDPGAGRAGRVHGVHVLLPVPLRDDRQGARLPRVPDGELPYGGRLALPLAGV